MKGKSAAANDDTQTLVEVGAPRIADYHPGHPIAAPDLSQLTVAEIVNRSTNIYAAYLKTYAASNMDPDLAAINAARVWRSTLPELVDRKAVIAYIACVAWGHRLRLLDPGEVKLMMFTAQTALTLLKAMPTPPAPPAPPQPQPGELFPPEPQHTMEAPAK